MRVCMVGTICGTANCWTPEAAQFDVFLTTDRNIRYQKNLSVRRISIIVLSKGRWKLIKAMLSAIAAAVDAATPGSFIEIQIPVDG